MATSNTLLGRSYVMQLRDAAVTLPFQVQERQVVNLRVTRAPTVHAWRAVPE